MEIVFFSLQMTSFNNNSSCKKSNTINLYKQTTKHLKMTVAMNKTKLFKEHENKQ